MSDTELEEELAGLLPPEELAGLTVRIRAAMEKLVAILMKNREFPRDVLPFADGHRYLR